PGNPMSSIKHFVSPRAGDVRKDSPDKNAWTLYPTCWSRPDKDSRTDSLSSTIDTSGCSSTTTPSLCVSRRLRVRGRGKRLLRRPSSSFSLEALQSGSAIRLAAVHWTLVLVQSGVRDELAESLRGADA